MRFTSNNEVCLIVSYPILWLIWIIIWAGKIFFAFFEGIGRFSLFVLRYAESRPDINSDYWDK